MKILNAIWFSNRDGCMGIVMVEDEYDGIKYYIGRGHGDDEGQDAEYISEWGSTFPKDAGDVLFGANRTAHSEIFDQLVRDGEGRN